MKLRLSILFLFGIFIFGNLQAKFVSPEQAENVAKHFYWERVNSIQTLDLQNITVKSLIVETRNNKAVIYHFNFTNQGFVSVSADDAAYPILAYDFSNHISNENVAVNYADWISQRADEIAYIRKTNIPASTEIMQEWSRLENSDLLVPFGGKSIDPLLHAKWNQDSPYNALSPADQFGPGGHAYAGCVAVAMAQIIYYYRYPISGSGSHSYLSNYGMLTANFANATYDYNSMTNQVSSLGNPEVAELLYHCAVGVEMGFSASGSGAFPSMSVTCLKQNFNYQNNLSLLYKKNYSYSQWVSKIVNNIDNKIPLFYAGYSPSGGSGHAFNLDGYQGNDFFHFNWGWGGAFNGYFYLNALNPGSSSFTSGQQAIFDIYPAASNYPSGCSSGITTISTKEGTLYDGSGPSDYQNNLDCQWLIQPSSNIDHIIISFDEFDLSSGDTLILYDGNSINAAVLGKFTGGNLPNSISSSGPSIFVRLLTDNSITSNGFGISYRSIMPVYCSGITQLMQATDTFSDGSNNHNYNNGTICRWHIKPSNGLPVRLFFTNFKTETGKDFVKIYDPSTSPSTLLATYSGNSIPKSVYSNSGEMMIIFQTNQSNTEAGWEAYYISGASVGMENLNNKNDIQIYPNPSNHILNIRFNTPLNNSKISIYSIDGKLMQSNIYNSNKEMVSLFTDDLSEGYYILRVQTENYLISKSFIIKH